LSIGPEGRLLRRISWIQARILQPFDAAETLDVSSLPRPAGSVVGGNRGFSYGREFHGRGVSYVLGRPVVGLWHLAERWFLLERPARRCVGTGRREGLAIVSIWSFYLNLILWPNGTLPTASAQISRRQGVMIRSSHLKTAIPQIPSGLCCILCLRSFLKGDSQCLNLASA